MRKVLFYSAFIIFSLSLGLPAHARVEIHQFDDPQQEARYKRLINELRCLVCQNQNLADSNAELALDLRQKTYEMIRAGDTDQQIIDYMVARYGEFVLYRPAFNTKNLVLWIGPFLILLLGLIILITFIRRQQKKPIVIDAVQHKRAQEMLRDIKDDSS